MQDDFNKWCDLWDKAVADGVFEDAPKPLTPTPQTSDPASFFGPVNSHPTSDVRDCDAQYWSDLYERGEPQLFQEEKESVKSVLQNATDAIVRSPNPITASSVGADQELTPGALGMTFSERDIEKLTQLKLELHELTSKMAAFEGEGKKAKKLESQLVALKKKIDEFSSELSRSLGDKKSVQGVELAPMR